jgi:predicted dehydrogenase
LGTIPPAIESATIRRVVSVKVGVCGAGGFASDLIPLIQAHPLVSEVRIAERSPERRWEQAERFRVGATYASLDELCRSDVDAIVITTQRWLHGPQAVQALRAGKHVASAVPAAITLEELDELVRAVKETGLCYMLLETSHYYPSAIYCRGRFAKGDFGAFVYGEGSYLHDMSHGFYDAFRRGGAPDWKSTASFPPLLYPTHSIAMVLSVTGARMTSVSALGYVDRHEDGIFREDVSRWGNAFSNETALFRTSDGGVCRINEFRRVGLPMGRSVRANIFGTDGSYEEQTNARSWSARDGVSTDLTELLRVGTNGVSAVHDAARLPREFAGLRNGHEGSQAFLICDFIESCTSGALPPNNVWRAARYTAPGIVAHESASRDAEPMAVPDFGDAPAVSR